MHVSAFQVPSTKFWLKYKAPANVIHINSVQQLVDAMVGWLQKRLHNEEVPKRFLWVQCAGLALC